MFHPLERKRKKTKIESNKVLFFKVNVFDNDKLKTSKSKF